MFDNPLAGQRVLVVEDEMMILMAIEEMLADLGCESVVSAATVNQALALIRTQRFDVAMLDVNLNGRVSYPIADALDALAVPFLFSTGCSNYEGNHGYGGHPVISKPFQFSKLAETFKQLLAEKTNGGGVH